MARYAVLLGKGTTHATNAVGVIYAPAASMRQVKIYYCSYSSDTAPADVCIKVRLQRSTTAPTGTDTTPKPLDMADAACVTLTKEDITVNGTLTSGESLLSTVINQKATFQWYAPPGGQMIIPATASRGIHVLTPTGGGIGMALATTWHFEE